MPIEALGRHLALLAPPADPPCVVGDESAADGIGRCVQEGLRHAQPERWSGFVEVVGQRSAGRPDREVCRRPFGLGAVGSERRDRDVDESGVGRTQVLPPESVPGHLPRAGGLDEEVGGGGQVAYRNPAWLGFQVGREAPLSRCEGVPEQRVSPVERGHPPGRRPARGLNLHDLGPEAGQQASGQQTPFVGAVHHPEAVEESHDRTGPHARRKTGSTSPSSAGS